MGAILALSFILVSSSLSLIDCERSLSPEEATNSARARSRDPQTPAGEGAQPRYLLLARAIGYVVRELRDSDGINLIMGLLPEEQKEIFARKGVASIDARDDLGALEVLLGLAPGALGGGLLISSYAPASWSLIRCCYSEEPYADDCCEALRRKKKHG